MFLVKSKSDLSTTSPAKAAKRAKAAGAAAVSNASTAAQNAAAAAQHAANAAQMAAFQAATTAVTAAHSAGDSAQVTATDLSKEVKRQVNTARKWAAPRIEGAADYTTGKAAPKVSSALRKAARQVNPAEPARSKRRSALRWSLLAAAVAAGLGAAAVVRYRYRAAIAADSEIADEEAMGRSSSTVGPDGAKQATSKDQNADTSVNGRVSSSSW